MITLIGRPALVLEFRHNNATDWILLVNAEGIVLSSWQVESRALQQFADCTCQASDWSDFCGTETNANEFGELVATRVGFELRVENPDLWVSRVRFHSRPGY